VQVTRKTLEPTVAIEVVLRSLLSWEVCRELSQASATVSLITSINADCDPPRRPTQKPLANDFLALAESRYHLWQIHLFDWWF